MKHLAAKKFAAQAADYGNCRFLKNEIIDLVLQRTSRLQLAVTYILKGFMKDHSSVFFPDVLALFNAVTREAYADTKLSEMFV